jgi:hypothetical protein
MVRAHLGRLAFALSPGIQWMERGGEAAPPDPLSSNLAMTLMDLVRFAQVGDLGDWDHDVALDAIQEVCSALYARAGEPGTFGVGALEDALDSADLDAIGLVLVGAYARYQLGQRGASVSARELAVLAGVDPNHVRLLARKGELKLEEGKVARAEARRWLGARGVRLGAGGSKPSA